MINKYLHLPQLNKVLPLILDLAIPITLVVLVVILISAILKLTGNIKRAGFLNKANLILIVFWFCILLLIGSWSTTASFCTSCHGVQAKGVLSLDYSHNKISCNECHRDKGALGKAFGKLSDARMILATGTGKYSKPIRSNVPDYRCLNCHSDILKKTITSKNIKVRHSDFTNTWRCSECHSSSAHGADISGSNVSVMNKCITCHDDNKAASDCKTCHADSGIKAKVAEWEPWKKTHTPGSEKGHGMADQKFCKACHKASDCSNCHTQMPHSSNFRERHGVEAKKQDNDCLKCHSRNNCTNCHQTELPHPPAFKKDHPVFVKTKGSESCKSCHTDRSCNDCHALHLYHPDNKTRL